jgi:hypothetical protein
MLAMALEVPMPTLPGKGEILGPGLANVDETKGRKVRAERLVRKSDVGYKEETVD